MTLCEMEVRVWPSSALCSRRSCSSLSLAPHILSSSGSCLSRDDLLPWPLSAALQGGPGAWRSSVIRPTGGAEWFLSQASTARRRQGGCPSAWYATPWRSLANWMSWCITGRSSVSSRAPSGHVGGRLTIDSPFPEGHLLPVRRGGATSALGRTRWCTSRALRHTSPDPRRQPARDTRLRATATSAICPASLPRVRITVNSVKPRLHRHRHAAAGIAGCGPGSDALKRVGTAVDIANVVGFLVSDKAAWITGQNLVADGGTSTCSDAGER